MIGRRRVLDAVLETPGANTRMVAERAEVDESTASYHLRRLQAEGTLASERVGREACWFPAKAGFCPVLRRAIPQLRRPEALRLAVALTTTPASAPALAARSGVPESSARYTLTVLEGAGIASRSLSGRAALREGADVCVEKARAAAPCSLWGRCAVSRALREAATREA